MKKRHLKLTLLIVISLFLIYVIIGAYRINKKYPDYINENYKIGDVFPFGLNEDIIIKTTDMRFEDYPEEMKENEDFEKVLLVDFEIENKSSKELGFTPLVFSFRNDGGYINGVNYELFYYYNLEEEYSKFEKQQFKGKAKTKITLAFTTDYHESRELSKEELEKYYIVVAKYPKYQRIFLRR